MGYALTTKSQVTVPKAVRQALGVLPGQEIDYEVKANGQVLMFPVKKPNVPQENPFLKWIGTGTSGMTTEEILNETRGEGWNR
ncbi:MAG: AbrB/MazE/SpoVT family DNA-binding domain-containing protein [Burkholderiales bacterium]|nr:MAG: AbrB/MazE/SpoVT family DNA-binding domain-containing protein [Burkholderiales bacterium]